MSISDDPISEKSTYSSTRLVSGFVYLRGWQTGLAYLKELRHFPFKARRPEIGLEIKPIATHAAQSIAISVSSVVIATIFQLLSTLITFVAASLAFSSSSFARGSSSVLVFLGILLAFCGSLILAIEMVYYRWHIVRSHFMKYNYNPSFRVPYIDWITERFLGLIGYDLIQTEETPQNVMVYDGYVPFLGLGVPFSGSRLTLDRSHGKEKREIDPVTIPLEDFYNTVSEAIGRRGLKEITQRIFLFADGEKLVPGSDILPKTDGAPMPWLSEDKIKEIGRGSLKGETRAYDVYQYSDPERDTIFSYVLRFHNQGAYTYLESVALVLPGITERLFPIDEVSKESPLSRGIKTALLTGLFTMFGFLIVLVFLYRIGIISYSLLQWWRNSRKVQRDIRRGYVHSYGHQQTFRESLVAEGEMSSYFGAEDVRFYFQAIEESLIDALINLSTKYGLDTSKLEQKLELLVNQGIMIEGGNFTDSQFSVGSGNSLTSERSSGKREGIIGQATTAGRKTVQRFVPSQSKVR